MSDVDLNACSRIMKVLNELEKQSTLERSGLTDISHEDSMLAITNDTGKFFSILLSSMNAKKILEVGTSVGYSTLWIAYSFYQNKENSHLSKKNVTTIDNNPIKVKKALTNFKNAGVNDIIEIIEGNSLEVLKHLSNKVKENPDDRNQYYDFIFLDADKENLTEYFDLALSMVKKGGIIVTDNVLYPEEYRPTMSKYLEHIRKKDFVQSVTVPIGYGEEISLKIR
ncbi:O-methyltransferase [Candidatus Nitrosocosmicus arcticus]|uniref:Putative O-methyltransferase n=1 Tax=Candidatus Nitrosocosmicus arcticus TaxID=2035267 RepID=A0A557SR62_9ARCH|nr:O-methyltransferase [Candidatus Nitrosocosmicus arcticus]TVP39083.1 putative O-methyltransferase [Candidatus Nitrosocosmicus arcticus]